MGGKDYVVVASDEVPLMCYRFLDDNQQEMWMLTQLSCSKASAKKESVLDETNLIAPVLQVRGAALAQGLF